MTVDSNPICLAPPVRVAIDIGGTFTDIQILEESTGRTAAHKTPTVPDDPAAGLVSGLQAAAARYGFQFSDISAIFHGTTIATNAVLQRRWPAGALITTRGFEDVLEIGRHVRRDIYRQIAEPQTLLIPRHNRFGVDERTTADGRIERPLDTNALEGIASDIATADIAAVAVVFMHAYANPHHEQQVHAFLKARLPNVAVSLSSDISPEIREYERTATTALNALLQPVVGAYLTALQSRLQTAGYAGPIYLVQSNGGVTTPVLAAAEPARLLLSGPSGGAQAAQVLAARLQQQNMIAVDMGGTSFDVSVVEEGAIQTHQEGEVAGLPVRLPMVEMRTIGAGGGSIARVEAGGRLRVGPESAGADPGPIAYGRGGQDITVTDANLVSGRLDATRFLDGTMPLDLDAAKAALSRMIAGPLNVAVEAAAIGIAAVSTSAMAGAIKLSLFEKGLDPEDFALLSFGGAGGLHAIDVAEELGIRRVIFPQDPGTLSAWGMLYSDILQDQALSVMVPATAESCSVIQDTIQQLQNAGQQALQSQGLAKADIQTTATLDMRYPGQAYELPVALQALDFDGTHLGDAVTAFHRLHALRFSFCQTEAIPDIVTVRVRCSVQLRKPAEEGTEADAPSACTAAATAPEQRFFADNLWQTAHIYLRHAIRSGGRIEGPAVIYEPHSTLWLGQGWHARKVETGALVAERSG